MPLGWRGNGAKLGWMTATLWVRAGRPGPHTWEFGPPVGGVVVLIRGEVSGRGTDEGRDARCRAGRGLG